MGGWNDQENFLFVSIEVVPPQMGPPEHLHARYDEGFLVVKGTFLFKGAGSTVKVSEGAWIFIPGGLAHTFRAVVLLTTYSYDERSKGSQG